MSICTLTFYVFLFDYYFLFALGFSTNHNLAMYSENSSSAALCMYARKICIYDEEYGFALKFMKNQHLWADGKMLREIKIYEMDGEVFDGRSERWRMAA